MEDKLQITREFLSKGLGRRKIARRLKITEWAARALITQAQLLFSEEELSRSDSKRTKKPKAKVTKTTRIKNKNHKNSRTTSIKVGRMSAQDPVSHKPVNRNTNLKVAVLSDIHYPYEDDKACQVADMFLDDYKPDVIVYNGDVADCYSVSSFDKSIDRKMTIQDEFDYTADKIEARLRRHSSVKETYFLEGNHENRFARLIQRNAYQLTSLRALSIQECLGLDSLGIEWITASDELIIGNLMFTHGHLVRKHAGSTARGHYEQFGGSICVGHCHRLAIAYKRNKYGSHVLIENGTLCDFDVEYAKFPDWQQGFTTIEFDGDDFTATSRAVINYKLIANGKVYAL